MKEWISLMTTQVRKICKASILKDFFLTENTASLAVKKKKKESFAKQLPISASASLSRLREIWANIPAQICVQELHPCEGEMQRFPTLILCYAEENMTNRRGSHQPRHLFQPYATRFFLCYRNYLIILMSRKQP